MVATRGRQGDDCEAMREPIRVGLVGAGNIALGDHVPAYLELPELFRLVAVADPTPERRALVSDAAGLGDRDDSARCLADDRHGPR